MKILVTGETGYSVLDIINTFEKVNETTKTIEDMCRDAWNFEKNVK